MALLAKYQMIFHDIHRIEWFYLTREIGSRILHAIMH